MTDWHKPSAAALARYLTEASVYVLATSVGADCYVCVLSHSAIALRCAPPCSVPSTTHQPPTTLVQSCPHLPPVHPEAEPCLSARFWTLFLHHTFNFAAPSPSDSEHQVLLATLALATPPCTFSSSFSLASSETFPLATKNDWILLRFSPWLNDQQLEDNDVNWILDKRNERKGRHI